MQSSTHVLQRQPPSIMPAPLQFVDESKELARAANLNKVNSVRTLGGTTMMVANGMKRDVEEAGFDDEDDDSDSDISESKNSMQNMGIEASILQTMAGAVNQVGMRAKKKTKGRVKIKMEFIENKLRRYTTFSKRKTGIMKKAYELSTLTGTQVMLLVASETGHVYTFATRKLQPMITSESGKALIQTCLNSPDQPPGSEKQIDQRMNPTGFEETELTYGLNEDENDEDEASPTMVSGKGSGFTNDSKGSTYAISLEMMNAQQQSSPSPSPSPSSVLQDMPQLPMLQQHVISAPPSLPLTQPPRAHSTLPTSNFQSLASAQMPQPAHTNSAPSPIALYSPMQQQQMTTSSSQPQQQNLFSQTKVTPGGGGNIAMQLSGGNVSTMMPSGFSIAGSQNGSSSLPISTTTAQPGHQLYTKTALTKR